MPDYDFFRLTYDRGFVFVSPGPDLSKMYLDDIGIRLYLDDKKDNYYFRYLVHGYEIELKSQTYGAFASSDFEDHYRKFRKEVEDYWSRRGG